MDADVTFLLAQHVRRASEETSMNSVRLSTSPNEGDGFKNMGGSQDFGDHRSGWMLPLKSNVDINSNKTNSSMGDAGNVEQWKRRRCVSENGASFGILWSAGAGPSQQTNIADPIAEKLARRIRRASSKDVEEAMAGGLNKAAIYMPPV